MNPPSPIQQVSPQSLPSKHIRAVEPCWIELTQADKWTLSTVQDQYDVPPEVMTYFLLAYQSPKLIHAGSALFLATFVVMPSASQLFNLYELKICVTATQIITLCESSGGGSSRLAQLLPILPHLTTTGAGPFLHSLLREMVWAYERVVDECLQPSPGPGPSWGPKRIALFCRLLSNQQTFLRTVLREGDRLFPAHERLQLGKLEKRVGQLVWLMNGITRKGGTRKRSSKKHKESG